MGGFERSSSWAKKLWQLHICLGSFVIETYSSFVTCLADARKLARIFNNIGARCDLFGSAHLSWVFVQSWSFESTEQYVHYTAETERMCVCVSERESERERERKKERREKETRTEA